MTNRTAETVAHLISLPIISTILQRLSNELPERCTFHSAQHSRDVLNEAVLFSDTAGRSPREQLLLAVSAAFHDAGFLTQPVDNEPIGAEMAADAMAQDGGFTPGEVELVKQMILDTRLISGPNGLQQEASTELSGFLLDADLSNFGRADFFDKLERLVKERGGDRLTELRGTLSLMQNHSWCTDAAHSLRDKKKQENIARLKSMIAGIAS